MDIGLSLPQGGPLADPATLKEVAIAAERQGYSSLWAFDRVMYPRNPRSPYPASPDGSLPDTFRTVLDPMIALSTAAAITERIRVGTNVLIAPLYSPVLLARAAASLDVLSGGRFDLGLGLGWSEDEYAAAGADMGLRNRRIEEMLEVMARAWSDDVVEITTAHEQIAACEIGLKPVNGRVPILMAAYTPAGLERIARRADGWTPAGIPLDAVGPMWQGILDTAERYGRDRDELRLVIRANVKLNSMPLGHGRPDFVGSIAEVTADIERASSIAHELILELHGDATTASTLLDIADELTAHLRTAAVAS